MNLKHNSNLNEFMLIYSMKIKSIKLGIFAAILTLTMLMFIQPIFAVEVPLITAEKVAFNFITYLGEDNYTISNVETLEDSGEIIGYLVNLAPQGYILIAGDTIRVPIKAYSLTSNFNNLPPAYVKILLNELKVEESLKKSASGKTSARNQPEEINSSYWEFITQTKIVSRKSLRNYTPDTYLLTTKWAQGYPYNKFNPKDGEALTLTGCVQTALAQVMRYHKHPSTGSGVFNHTWNGKTFTAVMNRPFNWEKMPDSLDSNTPQYQQDEVAALMRDLGVFNGASFGVKETGAYFNISEYKKYYPEKVKNEFEKAFGYAPIYYYPIEEDKDTFFGIIKQEINQERPLLLALPGHMTVADGYAFDPSGKKIHVNLGWGGASDNYYYLDQTITTPSYSFESQHTIYYNIKPCQGTECSTPYAPTNSVKPPVIGSYQNGNLVSAPNDIVIVYPNTITPSTIRIEAYDPDGDTVTLTAESSSTKLQTKLVGNLLTLTPTASNIFCKVTIKAQSFDGKTDKEFKVLVLDEMIYMGSNFNIYGQFANKIEIDKYKAYLGGKTTISGKRGYNNQGFYIWVKDNIGNYAINKYDQAISGNLNDAIYTIEASVDTYPYDSNYSKYTLTVTCDSPTATVSKLAETMEISLSDDNSPPSTNKPIVETSQATSITQNTATLNGKVNPNGVGTTYSFEYGTTTGYGTSTPADTSSGTTEKTVTANLTGLTPNTTYHFRLFANYSGEKIDGSDQTFTTTQQLSNPILSVSPANQNLSKAAGTTSFSISNTGSGTMAWSASVTSGSSWLSIKSGTSGNNSGTVTASYLANTTSSSRTATIRVTATGATGSPKDITLTQSSGLSPSVTTSAAKSITKTGAILTGTVNPNGSETAYYFEYGTTKDYEDSTESQSVSTGTKSFTANATLTDLSPATTYHFRIVATNSGGTIYGSDKTFTTIAIPKPVVTTGTAKSITTTSVTLTGIMKPNGNETDCYFEYGTIKDYEDSTESQSVSGGISSFTASATLTDLSPATTYNFRIVATNDHSTVYGSNKTFKTATIKKPDVTVEKTISLTSTAATLVSKVNPNGSETDCYFEYGTTKDYENGQTEIQNMESGTKFCRTSADLTDLSPNTTYYFRVVATNIGGTTYSITKSLKTLDIPRPIITTGAAKSVTSTSAALTGTVKPNGSETIYYFEYGTTKDFEEFTDSKTMASDSKSFTTTINITDLIPATTYYFRLVAENDYGTRYGNDKSFKTLAAKKE